MRQSYRFLKLISCNICPFPSSNHVLHLILQKPRQMGIVLFIFRYFNPIHHAEYRGSHGSYEYIKQGLSILIYMLLTPQCLCHDMAFLMIATDHLLMISFLVSLSIRWCLKASVERDTKEI